MKIPKGLVHPCSPWVVLWMILKRHSFCFWTNRACLQFLRHSRVGIGSLPTRKSRPDWVISQLVCRWRIWSRDRFFPCSFWDRNRRKTFLDGGRRKHYVLWHMVIDFTWLLQRCREKESVCSRRYRIDWGRRRRNRSWSYHHRWWRIRPTV